MATLRQLTVLILAFSDATAFAFSRGPSRPRFLARPRTLLRMQQTPSTASLVPDFLRSTLPLCENRFIEGPKAPISVADDPTAGMSESEIQSYMSNVGGGLCGYPEWVKEAVGVTLNLALISFGIFTVSYIVLYAIQFILDKQVEDTIKDADKNNVVKGAPAFSSLTSEGSGKFDFTRSMSSDMEGDGSGSGGLSRKERRLKERVRKNDNPSQ
jgi:hypothetical protein